jgi:hypothetical protein
MNGELGEEGEQKRERKRERKKGLLLLSYHGDHFPL